MCANREGEKFADWLRIYGGEGDNELDFLMSSCTAVVQNRENRAFFRMLRWAFCTIAR